MFSIVARCNADACTTTINATRSQPNTHTDARYDTMNSFGLISWAYTDSPQDDSLIGDQHGQEMPGTSNDGYKCNILAGTTVLIKQMAEAKNSTHLN